MSNDMPFVDKTAHNGGCLAIIARQLHRWGLHRHVQVGQLHNPSNTYSPHNSPKKQGPRCPSTPLTQLRPGQETPLVYIQRNVQRNCPPQHKRRLLHQRTVICWLRKQPARLLKATHSHPQHTSSTSSPGIQDTTVQGHQPRAWKILQLPAWQQHQHRKGTMRPIYTTVFIPLQPLSLQAGLPTSAHCKPKNKPVHALLCTQYALLLCAWLLHGGRPCSDCSRAAGIASTKSTASPTGRSAAMAQTNPHHPVRAQRKAQGLVGYLVHTAH